MIDQFRRIRSELDAFNPDFVLIWGDDQYENFREDCVPAFSILAYDSVDIPALERLSPRAQRVGRARRENFHGERPPHGR